MLFTKEKEEVVVPKINFILDYVLIETQDNLKYYLPEMLSKKMWTVDTETTGLDPHDDKVILLQIGDINKQYLIDTRVVDVSCLKAEMQSETRLKVLQNALFDYKMMLGSFDIAMEGMIDTMIAEKIITCGIKKFGFSLGDLCWKYLNIRIDKSHQKSFIGHTGPFTKKQLEYAALDVVYPGEVLRLQMETIRKEGLKETLFTECNAIPSFGDSEFFGMLLNIDAWEKNIKDEMDASEKSRSNFLRLVEPYAPKNLFGEADVNPASPAQLLPILEKAFPGMMIDPGTKKEGTGNEVLKLVMENCGDPPMIQSLMDYREHEKKVGTYGYTYIKHVHKKTGRFHPRISQLGTETGRPAGKKPNMLNIPRDARYRHPWIAEPGRVMLTNDYGACELRIMASMSKDPVMCKGFNDGLDYHTYTASQFIKDEDKYLREFISGGEHGKGKLGDFVLNESGSKVPNPGYGKLVPYDRVLKSQRTVAKTINFGWTMPLSRIKTYSIQGNRTITAAILSESNGNIGSVQRLTAETERLWTGHESEYGRQLVSKSYKLKV